MWVEQLRNGFRLVDRINIDGKMKRVSVHLDRDTPQARRKATEELNEKIRTLAHAEEKTSEISLEQAIEDYLSLKDCRESTRKNAKMNLKHCSDVFGNVKLSDLTPPVIRRTLYKANLKPTVINRSLSALKTFLEWCVDMEYLLQNPAKHIRPLKIDAPLRDPESLYLEPDRLKKLLDQLDGMAYYLTNFLALTGMRIGEASALLLEDIGPKYISVVKSYSEMTNEVTLPKNRSSIREVFIQPELRELINEYLKWRNMDIMSKGIRPSTLFYSITGGIYREQYLDRIINKLGAHPHILRHTHVALLAEQGVSLEAIARRIGHKGKGTTESVYYHVTEKQKQKDEEMLSQIRIL